MVASSGMLEPVVALIVWSLVVWLWMYLTRIPAMYKMRIVPDPNAIRGEQMSALPANVRWKADNYNHLMEQPTLFYAICLVLAMVQPDDWVSITLAWTYVLLRVLHSLVQVLLNKIELRFVLFILSSLALVALTFKACLALW